MKYSSLRAMQHLFGIIASVLHLGNIKFEADVRGYASLNNDKEMHWVSKVRHKQTADFKPFVCPLAIFWWKRFGVTYLIFFVLLRLCCAVAGDSYSGATTGLNPQED